MKEIFEQLIRILSRGRTDSRLCPGLSDSSPWRQVYLIPGKQGRPSPIAEIYSGFASRLIMGA